VRQLLLDLGRLVRIEFTTPFGRLNLLFMALAAVFFGGAANDIAALIYNFGLAIIDAGVTVLGRHVQMPYAPVERVPFYEIALAFLGCMIPCMLASWQWTRVEELMPPTSGAGRKKRRKR
jgi:hypothetical protein